MKLDLRKEFSEHRQEAVFNHIGDRKTVDAAEKFVDETIVPMLREQKIHYPALNYYCVTFYVVRKSGGDYICYNTDIMPKHKEGEPVVKTTEEILLAATVKAKENYRIEPIVFKAKNGNIGYRFEVKLF